MASDFELKNTAIGATTQNGGSYLAMVEAFLKANENRIFECCGISGKMPFKQFIKVADKLKNQLRNLPQVPLYRCDEPQNEKIQLKYSNSTCDNRGRATSSDRDVVGENDFSRLFYETQSIVQENSLALSSSSAFYDDRENTNYGHVSSTETIRATNMLEQLLANNLDSLRETRQPSSSTSKRRAKCFSPDKSFENWITGEQTQSPKLKKQKSNTEHTSAETNFDEQVPNITIAPDNTSATIVNIDVAENGYRKGIIELEIPQSLANTINMGCYKLKIDLGKITILKNFTKLGTSSRAKSKVVIRKDTSPKPKASAPQTRKKRGRKPKEAITSSSRSAEKSEVARFVELFSTDCNEMITDNNMSPKLSSNDISTTTGEIVQQALSNGHPSTNARNDTVSSTEVSSNQIATIVSTTNGNISSWYEQRSDELYTLPLDGLDMSLVRYINDTVDVEIIDQSQTNGETDNFIETILVPYAKYAEQQAHRRCLPPPVQLNPQIMNAAITSMDPLAAPGIKMNAVSEIDSDHNALDLTKQKSSSDNDLQRISESSIIISPSLDDVGDVTDVLIINDSNSNCNTDVGKPQKNTEISNADITCSKIKDNLDYNNISGDLDEIDYTKLLGDPHFDNDDEDAMSLCASLCGTPFRENLDDLDIPGEESFKHVYSLTPGLTTESDRASSMSRLEQLKSTMATGLNFTISTTTPKDSVRPNNTIPDQPKHKQPSNDKLTPFKIPKVSQEQKVVQSFRQSSISPLVDIEFEKNVEGHGTPIQTPKIYSAGTIKEFEKKVIRLFGENLCYENINNKCNIDNCKFSHDLYAPEVMKTRLKDLEKKGLDIAYKYIKQRHKLFNIYFPIFCELFGEKQYRSKLVELTMDCQVQSGCAKYLKNVVDGLMKTAMTRQKAIEMAMQKLLPSFDAINAIVDLILGNDSDVLEFIPKIEEFAVVLQYKFTHNQIIRMAQISNAKQDIRLNKLVFIIISAQSDILSTKNEHIKCFLKMIEGLEVY